MVRLHRKQSQPSNTRLQLPVEAARLRDGNQAKRDEEQSLTVTAFRCPTTRTTNER